MDRSRRAQSHGLTSEQICRANAAITAIEAVALKIGAAGTVVLLAAMRLLQAEGTSSRTVRELVEARLSEWEDPS